MARMIGAAPTLYSLRQRDNHAVDTHTQISGRRVLPPLPLRSKRSRLLLTIHPVKVDEGDRNRTRDL